MAVLKNMSVAFVAMIEVDRVAGEQAAHELFEGTAIWT